MKIKWPLVSRKKAVAFFDTGVAVGNAQNSATLFSYKVHLDVLIIKLGELKRENDLLKWRLMERDPEFVRDLEPEGVLIGPNMKNTEVSHEKP